eukprot:CAMPEP_0198150662 /NCGR_PEP_ID=MMETSP1443-20131203/51874_1 /TAXON_ID=186043 /ORGANISM="Entomoneis sp., Strain CCMP2396" /LENGTH=139 /DNA_ID=CAMNT_0043816041 /DNA_START=182 /DNA_END=601 /DNA_ORIENTATION=+
MPKPRSAKSSTMTKTISAQPVPPSRRPNIAERISMIQMASLSHTGYKPKGAVSMALPNLLPPPPSKNASKTKEQKQKHRFFKVDNNKNTSRTSSSSKEIKKNKTSTKQRIRFVQRLGNRKKDVPAEDVWMQLIKEGTDF